VNVWLKSFLTLVAIVAGATALTYGIEWLAAHTLTSYIVLGVIFTGVSVALIRYMFYGDGSDYPYPY
jgi:hypothetical protein